MDGQERGAFVGAFGVVAVAGSEWQWQSGRGRGSGRVARGSGSGKEGSRSRVALTGVPPRPDPAPPAPHLAVGVHCPEEAGEALVLGHAQRLQPRPELALAQLP